MTTTPREQVVSRFGLTNDQRDAALARGQDVIVTAGAGSGKTRTLVARYVSLIAEGLEPRRVVAITFTEKAAREMRSRVWDALSGLLFSRWAPHMNSSLPMRAGLTTAASTRTAKWIATSNRSSR